MENKALVNNVEHGLLQFRWQRCNLILIISCACWLFYSFQDNSRGVREKRMSTAPLWWIKIDRRLLQGSVRRLPDRFSITVISTNSLLLFIVLTLKPFCFLPSQPETHWASEIGTIASGDCHKCYSQTMCFGKTALKCPGILHGWWRRKNQSCALFLWCASTQIWALVPSVGDNLLIIQ